MKQNSTACGERRIMKSAGTLMFGKGVLSQFAYEMELAGAKRPVMLSVDALRKKARKAAAVLASNGIEIVVASEPEDDDDFLILAGGLSLVARWCDDPRPKGWIMLGDEDLNDYKDPCADYIVADSKFISSGTAVDRFLKEYAFSVTDGCVLFEGELSIPDAFIFSRRTKVLAGCGNLNELAGLIKTGATAMSKPMVLTDKGIVAVGLFDRLGEVLEGCEYELYDSIPPDSGSLTVNEISRIFKEKSCDGIIAMGGGSVLDTGKGVLMNISTGCEDLISIAGSNRLPDLKLPFIAVPTTSGTGSEVTCAAVVSDAEKGRKMLYISPKLMPNAAILDGRLSTSLPPFLTSITGMDALSHAVEAYTCLGKNPVSDQMALKAIELIRDNLVQLMTDPGNEEMRYNLALASNLAGQAFSNSMVGMVHTIGHSIGAVCHAPHGSCMAVLLPAGLEFNLSKISGYLTELLPVIAGAEFAASVEQNAKPAAAIEAVRRMNTELREHTDNRHPEKLSQIVNREGQPLIERSHFELIAKTAMGDASIIYNPAELKIADIMDVLEKYY